MGRAKKRKHAKDANRAASLLEDDAEAFQTKLDDFVVQDVTEQTEFGGQRGRRGRGKGRGRGGRFQSTRDDGEDPAKKYQEEIKELAPIEEEERPYELLLSSLGGVNKEQISSMLRKRKLEEEENDQEDKREKRRKKDKDQNATTPQKNKQEEDESNDSDNASEPQSEDKTEKEEEQALPEEEEELTVALATTEEEKETDTYRAQYDKDLDASDLDVPNVWQELEPNPILGKVWSNSLESIPAPEVHSTYNVKQRLVLPWNIHVVKKYARKKKSRKDDETNLIFTQLQANLFPLLNNYYDIMMTDEHYKNNSEIQSLYTLHALNHAMKIRDRVIRHTSRLMQPNVDLDLELRDQGFTRPRILILLPTRNSCWEFVQTMLALTPKVQSQKIHFKKKFHDEFFEETGQTKTQKPEDWLARFRGNNDDNFRIGITFSQSYCKLYSEFNSSDIIVASPLGLKLSIEGNNGDIDFLSSIELVIADAVENALMQNWDHIAFLFKSLNQMPKEYHGVDVTRIRISFIDGNAKFMRQTLIFSEVNHVLINNLFNKQCFNITGKVKLTKAHSSGTVCKVLPQIKQLFQRLDCDSVTEVDDLRFDYFCNNVYPHLVTDLQQGVLIFIPSYLDFVRVRNFMRVRRKKGDVDFVQCCEYTKSNQVVRNRAYFANGTRDFMLYTERFHFFHRYVIKGIKKIVFYSLPSYPEFYPEVLNLLPDGATCLTLFTKFDLYQLEPVLGQKRSNILLTSAKAHHLLQ